MDENYQSEWTKSIPLKEQKQIIKRLLVFAKPFKQTFIVAILFALGLSVINVILPRIIQSFMDNHLANQSATTQVILFFAGLYLFGVIVKSIIWFFQWYLYSMASLKTFQHIRVKLFEKLHTLGMRYFDQTPAGSIVSRVTNDTETLFEFWYVFLMVLTGIFAVISSLVAMIQINVKITLWTLIFLPILGVVIWYYQKFSSRIYRNMREKLSQLNTKLNESISGMKIIQQFRQEARLANEFEEVNDDYLATRYAMIKTNSILLSPIINFLYALAIALVLTLFGIDALHSPVEVGLIYAFTTYVQGFFNPMSQMMDFLSVFTDGIVAGSRILKIMDTTEYAPQQEEHASGEIINGKIEFRNVSFSYDGKNNVLNNISFVANPGETVALVGHTGSGKSSIINVLMRFYEFYEGEILIDDRDIRSYPINELREKMGLVLQDAFLFYGDIAGNIRMFNDKITDEQIREAAEFVQANRFIDDLPQGYHSKVIERGASYSSGQRQLITFARTIVTDPKILVLDEATANIDTETEGLIQEGLAKMRQGRTTIAIAHRLSTIRDAELILVLDKGKIVERGNHEELLQIGGLYADMYQLQSS
ncbi:ABC transporter ATP-binding protein [Enterococcus thailandicus]|uniref:ABC transporter ATP-binding protein n=1 Tax=Enterococcus thailandicus TaxID=417368 RepID=A0A179EQR0_ENTTH|nr:ABC transporter ATP-binding protein [Enterococcus thailandicus]ASZ06978.1 ABC transporter ATP-binding protein [Enterococcus thailandicus]MDK4352482.1 ABC transporter ATP-binding protein/permease [Enterococcus thailandicus]MDT2734648.1 ABC transporter ATP-binding protein [Enterococcus thailandicus]MDT2751107.1 ABC transporter ATP-binding protein [Enterococcus thailandicus]MDT2775566.1 ABC transporter ATP-binding protein [Enterococcus thailandicus]